MSKRSLQCVAPSQPEAGTLAGAFVCYFPSGAPQRAGPADSGGGGGSGGVKFSATRGAKGTKQRSQVVLHGRTDAVTYSGANTGGENAALWAGACQYALGVVDEEHGTVCFHPVASRRVLRCEARVVGLDYGAPPWEPVDDSAEARARARAQLDDAFATDKRRRTTARMAAARSVPSEALPDAHALAGYLTAATNDTLTSQQLASRLAGVRNIPPHNPDAKTPADAYSLDRLCDPATLAALPWKQLLSASKSGGARVQRLHEFVQDRLVTCVAALPEAKQREKAAQCGAYLSCLLRFCASAPRQFNADWWTTGPLSDLPTSLRDHLAARFTDGADGGADVSRPAAAGASSTPSGSRPAMLKRPQALRDLLIAYILVCALMLEQYRMDFRDVAAALQMEPGRLLPHFLALGCRIVRPGGAKEPAVAVLMHEAGPDATLASFLPSTTTKKKAAARKL